MSTYRSAKVGITAVGITNGATVTTRLYARDGSGHTTVFATTTFKAMVRRGVMSVTWMLNSAQRHELRTHVRAGDQLFFQIIRGSTKATGQFR